MSDDDDLLPPEDHCAFEQRSGGCGRTRAVHVGWENGGPSHEFVAPVGKPRPERITSCHIQTDWVCTQCGAACDVWGVAEGWMECSQCQGGSFLVPFLTEDPLQTAGSPR